MIKVKTELKTVRRIMSNNRLNLKASNVNKVKWCINTEINKKLNIVISSNTLNY